LESLKEEILQKPMQKLSTLLSQKLKYLTAVILIAVPLYPKFPLINVPNTYVSIRLEDFVLLLSALILFFIMLPKVVNLFQTDLIRAILIYLVVGLVSLVSAILLTKTVIPAIGFLNWLRRLEYFVPFFLGLFAMGADRKNLEFYVKIIIFVVIVAFIYGFGQKYFSFPVIITQNEEYSKGVALRWIPGSHINSTFAGHYDLASFIVLTLPFLISAFFLLKGKLTKFVLAITVASGLWLLVNAASRISLVSYLISACLALIFIKKYKAMIVVMAISVLFIFTSTNLLNRYERIIEVTRERLKINFRVELVTETYAAQEESTLPVRRNNILPTSTPPPVFEDRSTSIRLNVEWPRAVRALAKNPLLGTGYSSITLATDNDFLRALGETGLLGLLSFLLIFLRLVKMFFAKFPIWKSFKGLELAFFSGVFASLPGLFVNAFFIDIFEASKFAIIFWLFMGIMVSLANDEKYNYSL